MIPNFNTFLYYNQVCKGIDQIYFRTQLRNSEKQVTLQHIPG